MIIRLRGIGKRKTKDKSNNIGTSFHDLSSRGAILDRMNCNGMFAVVPQTCCAILGVKNCVPGATQWSHSCFFLPFSLFRAFLIFQFFPPPVAC